MNHDYNVFLVVACDQNRGIGKDGKIPWNVPEDMKFFSSLTSNPNVNGSLPIVIMGRKTYQSLPVKCLSNRINIVITKATLDPVDGVYFCTPDMLENQLQILIGSKIANNYIYVIGGTKVYEYALSHFRISKIYVTDIFGKYDCDTFFPLNLDTDFCQFNIIETSKILQSKTGIWYRFVTYAPSAFNESVVNQSESLYLKLMHDILIHGDERIDRTNVGTKSLFGKFLEYDISETFPISTTKRVFMRAVFEELMLYLRGQTDNSILTSKGIHIWDGNTSREFLDKHGMYMYAEGDMGATYGFNFRHFGADYAGCTRDYTNKGVDQLRYLIYQLKNNPTSRRMIISLWDPYNNSHTALPSCLCMYQFYVRNKTILDLQIYIRSSDYFLANNWNTCTGALLVYLLCNTIGLTHLTPGKLTVCMGDVHLYLSHLEQVKLNLSRKPLLPPKLIVKQPRERVEDFEFSDLEFIGYKSHPAIKAPMAV